jgi:mxaJ protein
MSFRVQRAEASPAGLTKVNARFLFQKCHREQVGDLAAFRCTRTRFIFMAAVPFLLAHSAVALNVCADPDYLPYSSRAEQGFENRVASAVAHALGETVQYSWASYRGRGGFSQFLASTLDAKKCDVVMSLPYGSREELTTTPYYVSSYIFVFPKSKQYSISSIDSPALKALRIGFEHDTPAQESLKLRGLIGKAVGFDVAETPEESPEIMLKALTRGKIDVLITWEPSIGYFLRNYPNLEVLPVPNSRTLGAPEQFSFPMSMAVRTNDKMMKEKLDRVIQKNRAGLESVLTRSGVRLFGSEAK